MSVKVKKQKKQRTTDLFAPSNAVNNVRVRSFLEVPIRKVRILCLEVLKREERWTVDEFSS